MSKKIATFDYIDLDRNRCGVKDFLAWLILEGASADDEGFSKMIGAEGFDPKALKVELTINGIPFNVTDTLVGMHKQYATQVLEEAKKLATNSVGDLEREFGDFIESMENRFKASIEEQYEIQQKEIKEDLP